MIKLQLWKYIQAFLNIDCELIDAKKIKIKKFSKTGKGYQQAACQSSAAELEPSIGLCVLECEISARTNLGSSAAGDVATFSHPDPE